MGRAGAADGGPRHPRQTRSVHVYAPTLYSEPQMLVLRTGAAEECETEYDQLRQGLFDSEWGSFLCTPVRSGVRAAGEAATGSHEVTTAGLDGNTHRDDSDYDRYYEGHGQPSEPFRFVARAARHEK
jgi:hypothetical protein